MPCCTPAHTKAETALTWSMTNRIKHVGLTVDDGLALLKESDGVAIGHARLNRHGERVGLPHQPDVGAVLAHLGRMECAKGATRRLEGGVAALGTFRISLTLGQSSHTWQEGGNESENESGADVSEQQHVYGRLWAPA